MKRAISVVLSVVMVIGLIIFYPTGSVTPKASIPQQIAPINRDAVVEKLISDGKLASNASQDQIATALRNYIGDINANAQKTQLQKVREGIIEKQIENALDGSSSQGKKIGQAKKLTNAQEIAYGSPAKTVKVLVLLADYSDYTHNSIPKPDITRNYWTGDFSQDHYNQLLFEDGYYTTPEGTKSASFKEYFKQQSNGSLNIEGAVYGWYKVGGDAIDYGEQIGNGIHDKDAAQLVIDVTEKAVADGLELSDYDIEDPYDLDHDGDLEESDGIVDHLMVIHAGKGQEAGGGVNGDNAIWSHSSSVDSYPVSIDGSDTAIYSYTVEAEDGAVGLFTHEFTHDLGMPDDYDTAYTADGDISEYWSLMSSGSWSGKPAGSMPSGINPYSRILLGNIHGGVWINNIVLDYDDLTSPDKRILDTASLNTGNLQAVVIELPADQNKLVINKPAEGTFEFSAGKGDEIDNTLTTPTIDLSGKTGAELTYKIWYNIEENWDAGFIQVSTDAGLNWTSLATPYTVDDFENPAGYPTILAKLPGYTGSSEGWLSENIDISNYAGKEIQLRFRYATDWGTSMDGMFIDQLTVTADGIEMLSENAETDFGQLTADGWERATGTQYGSHYYVGEWRSHLGVDEGLKYNAKARVEYNQGLLLWYVNNNFTDNWVGDHPGFGQLGVVDSTQYVYLNAGLGNGNESAIRAGYMPFVQLHDAAFSTDKAANMDLSIYSWAKNPNLKARQAEPLFDDSNSYFSVKSPYSGLKLPELGIKIRVLGNANDYSRGEIVIYK